MNPKNERLILAIGEVSDKYVKETESKMNKKSIIKVAVALVAVVALSLYLFIPFAPVTGNLTAYKNSSYFPLIKEIEEYRLGFAQPVYKNNFEGWVDLLGNLFRGPAKGDANEPTDGASPPPAGGNGSYVESTDNQVEGVIESDILKMTDKYIFRIGIKNVYLGEGKGKNVDVLRVYSIEKENSALVAEFEIARFDNERYHSLDFEMYLSPDGNRVTILKNYSSTESKTGIISIDVSDVNNITEVARISVDGTLNTSRMVDGKLLLVSNYQFIRNQVDYNDPKTFVPSIDRGNGEEPIQFADIIYPDEISNTKYSVVAMVDAQSLSLLGASALLNFTNQVYVSAQNIYISREYVSKRVDGNTTISTNMSDVAVLGYSGDSLEKRGIISLEGWTEDQYSFDELDGYLRVVSSTRETKQIEKGDNVSSISQSRNAGLYIFDLNDLGLKYSVENFAPEGEQATAVRFDGDKLYVCTAVVVTFTDPVYFFDLSDYENITYTDTGIIEGYSDHLINFGEGLTLGIGRESWRNNKIEIYAEREGVVNSIHEYRFEGQYSENYKSYLVNREENLFGFGVDYFMVFDENGHGRDYQRYLLMKFTEEELKIYSFDIQSLEAGAVRAVFIDGYLYITTAEELVVEKIV